MPKNETRPSWFKLFRHQKALIDSVPDATAGKAIKAVFQYFDSGEIIEMEPIEFAVFSALKPYVDESFTDYEASRKKMALTRWKGLHPNGTLEDFETYYASKNQIDVP